MNSTTLKITIALVVTFLLGAVTGIGVSQAFHHIFFPPPGPKDIQEHIAHFLTEKLDLTPDQQTKIQPIVAEFVTQLDSLQAQSTQQLLTLSAASDDKIRPLLNLDQQEKLVELGKERAKMMGRHGFMPPP